MLKEIFILFFKLIILQLKLFAIKLKFLVGFEGALLELNRYKTIKKPLCPNNLSVGEKTNRTSTLISRGKAVGLFDFVKTNFYKFFRQYDFALLSFLNSIGVIMKLAFKDARFFKQCVDAIVNLVEEGTFEISKDSIRLRSLDPSQIAMVDFTLDKGQHFSSEVEGIKNVSLNLSDLSKILSRTRGSEKLLVMLDESEGNKLQLEFTSEVKRNFKLPLLDTKGMSMPREPKVEFETNLKIKAYALKEMLKDVGLLSSHLQLEISDENFIIEAHGDSGDLKIETGKSKELEFEKSANSKAIYPFEYFDKMCKAALDNEIIHLEFGTNKPAKISYKISDAQLVYYLAPRVETA